MIAIVVETESARERDHADVRAHPATARAEKSSRETHTRRAATTGSAKEKTDTLVETDVEEAATGTEVTVVLSDETAVTTRAEVLESAATAVISLTTAEVVVEEAVTVTVDAPLNNPSTKSAVPALRESPRSLLPILPTSCPSSSANVASHNGTSSLLAMRMSQLSRPSSRACSLFLVLLANNLWTLRDCRLS